MNILITNHSIMYNRGSEAVIRSITQICRYWRPDSFITVSTGEESEILKDILDADSVVPRYDSLGGIRPLLKAAAKADVVLVTGADNYDSPSGNPVQEEINSRIMCETSGRTVLYDCSLNRNNFREETRKDFMRFSCITARESITYQLLSEKFPTDKLKMYPDPAFIMPMEKCPLPVGFEHGKMIGINISNLILSGKYGADREQILQSYHNLIHFILEQTDYKIILVQHIINNGFDLEAQEKLYADYKKESRVLLIKMELLNAMQVKYLISKLDFLITARTHAAIAAYSTCVPTLAVSYSIKSIGIARDIFGESDPCVLPLYEMKNGTELRNKFEYMLKQESEIRRHLQKVIPKYKMRSLQFGEIL